MTAALRHLVECRALLAHEPEVQHLPRGKAGRAIVEQPTVPEVAVEAIHLPLQTIEARLLPRTRSEDRGFHRRDGIGVLRFGYDRRQD